MLEDKFNITQEQNVFVVKRNLIDYIWKSAKIRRYICYLPTDRCYSEWDIFAEF